MSRECWGCRVRPHEAEKCERLSGGFKTWQQHHWLPQSVLRREGHGALVGDERNMTWFREWHHMGLENRVGLRVHFEQVPAEAVDFAQRILLEWKLIQLYPPLLDVVSGAVPSTGPEFEEALRLLSELAVTPASDVEGDDLREERWEP